MNKLFKFITAPFRMGRDFVDTRPSFTQVKQYLAPLESTVVPDVDHQGHYLVRLLVPGTDIMAQPLWRSEVASASLKLLTAEDRQLFSDGVAEGFRLSKCRITELRRSTINRQLHALRKVRQAERQAKKVRAVSASADALRAAWNSAKEARPVHLTVAQAMQEEEHDRERARRSDERRASGMDGPGFQPA